MRSEAAAGPLARALVPSESRLYLAPRPRAPCLAQLLSATMELYPRMRSLSPGACATRSLSRAQRHHVSRALSLIAAHRACSRCRDLFFPRASWSRDARPRAGAGSLGRLLLLELSSLTPKSVRLLAMFIGGSKDARSACGQRACRVSSHSAFAGDRTARHIMRAQGAALSM